jgi:methionyl-tRNA formyltransferase
MAAPLSIAYFGLPLGALLLAADGHRLALVACCRREAPGVRRAARRFGDRFVVRPDARDPALAGRVRRARADLLVSWFWTTRLPAALVGACPLGGLGVHPSLLPRHRGPDPYYWTIRLGDAVAGVTAHRLADDYDTGAVLGRRALAVDPSWNAWQLARALDRPSLALLRETVARFAAGDPPAEEPQDEALATAAPEPDDGEAALRFARPTGEVVRHVRALAPSPGAYVDIGGEDVTVTRVEPVASFPAALAPAEAAIVAGRAVVRTADGAVALLEGEADGRPLGPEGFAALVARARPDKEC